MSTEQPLAGSGTCPIPDDHQGARGDARKRTAQGVPDVTLTENELMSLEGAFLSQQISVQQVVEAIVATRVQQAEAALVAKVEALANEWERNYANMLIGGFSGCSIGADTAAKRLRALLLDTDAGEALDRVRREAKAEGETAAHEDTARALMSQTSDREVLSWAAGFVQGYEHTRIAGGEQP